MNTGDPSFYNLVLSGDCPPSVNMAMDEDIALSVTEGNSPPTLRIYGWDRPALTLGRFQTKLEGINTAFLMERGIEAVRRPTGGRAILHGNDITYSFCSRYEGPFRGKGLRQCYEIISGAIIRALELSGIRASMERAAHDAGRAGSPHCFQSVSYAELTVNGKKIVGSAQRRWPGGFLQQGSIPVHIDEELNGNVFENFAPEKMISLAAVSPGFDTERFILNLKEGFQTALGATLLPAVPPSGPPALQSLEKYRPLSF